MQLVVVRKWKGDEVTYFWRVGEELALQIGSQVKIGRGRSDEVDFGVKKLGVARLSWQQNGNVVWV